jgi:hypothetical protein
MTSPLHPAFFRYLRGVQKCTSVGLHSFCTAGPRSPRTVYRWQQSLGDQLLVVPNVSVEALGLRHAHLFITAPSEKVLGLPYAVEAAWITPDFCQEVLYLHCLVPAALAPRFPTITAPLGSQAQIIWSSSGWQQFLIDTEEILLPVDAESVSESDLLRRLPFVVPAMMELWRYPNSLPVAWHRIHARLGSQVKTYLPRTKVRYVNGKTHITQAFRLLDKDGLIRQQLIRYHPLLAVSVEVFVLVRLEREDVMRLLEGLRHVLHGIESYPTSDGYWCRLLGPHRLLDAIMNLPARVREQCSLVYFHTKRHPSPMVRFAYETAFDITNRSWRA